MQGSDHDLDTAISNVFIFMLLLPGMITLAPESPIASANAWTGNATTFLITRAVDRNILYRSRASFLYVIGLVIFCAVFLLFQRTPDLRVTLGGDISPELCLSRVPGSVLAATESHHQPQVFIPDGNLLIAGWHLWAFLLAALGIQLLYLIRIRKLGWLRNLSVPVRVGLIAIWVFVVFQFGDYFMDATDAVNNHIFFSFAGHQPLFWLVTLPALIYGQLWCERRFSRVES